MKDGTYRCYERGPGSAKFIALEYKHAREFAQVFKVRWEWLLDGLGEPWLTERDAEEGEEGEEEEEREPNHLQAWRVYRGLTVAQLSKKSGISPQTITGIESGEMDPSTKLMSKLADALDATLGYLLDHLPEDADPNIFNAVKAIPKERRSQALEILKTFRPYNKLP
jgi:transcriptional regulator with XRE-family HTH domain